VNCPKCMKKPLDWKVAVKNICPKCGSEMEKWGGVPYRHSYPHCPRCGYEIHEEELP
jgi:transposase-like protein